MVDIKVQKRFWDAKFNKNHDISLGIMEYDGISWSLNLVNDLTHETR